MPKIAADVAAFRRIPELDGDVTGPIPSSDR
jgi:hypothetical protein